MKPNLLVPLVLAACAAACAAQTNSQTSENWLPPVVVSADAETDGSLTVPSYPEAKRQLRRIPGGVAAVDADAYLKGRATGLADTLRLQPGVFAQSRFGAEEAKISIRGSGAGRNFHGRGILVMQDGIPVNLADGGYDMQSVEPLAARYVEILRGANALPYGSGYLGGSVNYISRTGHDASPLQARFEAGSFDFLRGQVSSGLVTGEADYYASLTHFSQTGFRDHARQSSERGFANVGWRVSETVENRFFVTALDSRSKLPGSITKAQTFANAQQANAGSVLGNQQRNYELLRLQDKVTARLDEGEINASVFWSGKDLDHPIAIWIDQNSHDVGGDFSFRSRRELLGNRNEFVAGVRPIHGWVEDNRFTNTLGNRAGRISENSLSAFSGDLYVENSNWVLDDLALVAGGVGTLATRDVTRTWPNATTLNQQYTGFSPKAGLLYDIGPDQQAYLNVSRSFEAPSFGELQVFNFAPPGPGATPAVRLAAQTATTVELGTRGREDWLGWDVTLYHAWVENELLTYSFPNGTSSTVNADETIHQGIELGLETDLVRNLLTEGKPRPDADRILLRQVYTWSNLHFDNDPTYGNSVIAGLPEHLYQADLTYEHPCGFYAGPNAEWSPAGQWVDNAHTLRAPGYITFGVKAGYRPRQGISIFLEARNLADRTYIPTVGAIANAAGIDQAQFYPGDGRALYGGIEWSW